jgi:hypothetical protein
VAAAAWLAAAISAAACDFAAASEATEVLLCAGWLVALSCEEPSLESAAVCWLDAHAASDPPAANSRTAAAARVESRPSRWRVGMVELFTGGDIPFPKQN